MRALWIAILALGCHEAPTQIVVVVGGDLAPADRATIRIDVEGSGSRELVAPALPFSFGIHARRDRPDVRVAISGLRADGTVTVERTARLPFARGETRRASLPLEEACRFVWGTCAEGNTCRGGACVSEALPLDELPVVEPGRELDDAGP